MSLSVCAPYIVEHQRVTQFEESFNVHSDSISLTALVLGWRHVDTSAAFIMVYTTPIIIVSELDAQVYLEHQRASLHIAVPLRSSRRELQPNALDIRGIASRQKYIGNLLASLQGRNAAERLQ